jgi:hypothetical protein
VRFGRYERDEKAIDEYKRRMTEKVTKYVEDE